MMQPTTPSPNRHYTAGLKAVCAACRRLANTKAILETVDAYDRPAGIAHSILLQASTDHPDNAPLREAIQIEGRRHHRTATDAAGREVDYDATVALMDDELREEIHREGIAPTPSTFLAIYANRHRQRFDEDFPPFHGGAW